MLLDGKELGPIVVRRNPRAKHYNVRVIDGKIYATIPKRGTESGIVSLIDSKRDRLREMLDKNQKRPVLNEESHIKTYTFELHIFRTCRSDTYISLKEGILHIACPEETDFNDDQVQQKLWSIFTKALRVEAMRVLPPRLATLASINGFQYSAVTVRNTKTRWGSCSSKKRISLSSSLMLLPEHLIDYVLLHELCHTLEMNHSVRFRALINKVTNGCADQLRKELKVIPAYTEMTFK
ncbi:MAG: M48 family metallopeptidase [Tannerella sp.]|nr:M48 family metallopeptidase [Tannerella sp.]